MIAAAPLILTAALDPASQQRFERERRQHFPSALNVIPAHVTLFHYLPGEEADGIDAVLTAACLGLGPAPFTTTGLRFLGRGSAYDLLMPRVADLRRDLAARWADWLTPQDRQGWKPHVTVQNKAPPPEAKRVHAALQAGFAAQAGQVTGLQLWRYLGGPWQHLADYPFVLEKSIIAV